MFYDNLLSRLYPTGLETGMQPYRAHQAGFDGACTGIGGQICRKPLIFIGVLSHFGLPVSDSLALIGDWQRFFDVGLWGTSPNIFVCSP
jgi:hypothetical protein